jgi:uncharacterized protein (TIGR02757 family)
MKNKTALKALLDGMADNWNAPGFIQDDPISIPHRFKRQDDIEIAAFFAATLAWGQRKSIIASTNRLMAAMDEAPADFVRNHTSKDLRTLRAFVHRTFKFEDLACFLRFFQYHYQRHSSLEPAFTASLGASDIHVGEALTGFHNYFFSLPHEPRTRKHVSTPARGSACKRLNMFLRWMVRSDRSGVDFGIWKGILPSQLLCPLDLHVQRAALELGLLTRQQADWKACLELTERLRSLDAVDPVRYDYALFGWSLSQKQAD